MIRQRFLLHTILFLIGATSAIAQKPTFHIVAEEVQLYVLATNNGKPVEDLQAADFDIYDNGVKQTLQYATLQKKLPISATLVFDMSMSVKGQLLDDLKDAAHEFLTNLRKDDQAGLITFNHAIALGSPPTHDFKTIKLALDQTKPEGFSSLFDASYAGLAAAEAAIAPSLLLIFSDGNDTCSWLTSSAVLESAQQKETVIYSVSTGLPGKKSLLKDLAESTGGSQFFLGSSLSLSSIFLKILEDFRQHYLVTYIPQGVSESGWHKLEVLIRNRSLKVKTRPGYMRGSPMGTATGVPMEIQ
jgi:VWFA-related protein